MPGSPTSMVLIRAANLRYAYDARSDNPIEALRGFDLELISGEHLAIVGQNGSGKSTLAKCLAGLLQPGGGDVWVKGWNTRDASTLYDIRAAIGIVFQNPDSQFVATTVAEEVAFGPENLGVPQPQLGERVEQALYDTRLADQRDRNPRFLSAGEKARLAIAGALAMHPECLILDESTALLDPPSRHEILTTVLRLLNDQLAIVSITHYMEEAALADRVLVLDKGAIAIQGRPREVFGQRDLLDELGLGLPPVAAIASGLRQRGLPIPDGILTQDELVRSLVSLSEGGTCKIR